MEDSEEEGEGRMIIFPAVIRKERKSKKAKGKIGRGKKIQLKSYPADVGRRMDIGRFSGRGGGIV